MKTLFGILLVIAALQNHAPAQIGQIAPDFQVTDTHGRPHRLYDYLEKGKTVVLDFFFTTCIPCQYYTPQVNLAYKKYGCNQKDVVFIAIDYNDTEAAVRAYDETYKIEYPSISGKDGGGNAVVHDYQVIGFPTFYVIDSSKKVVMEIDPPTLQVFDYRFNQLGLVPKACDLSNTESEHEPIIQNTLSNLISGNILTFVSLEPVSIPQSLILYDGAGQRVGEKFTVPPYTQQCAVHLGDLPSGYYFGTLQPKDLAKRLFAFRFVKL